MGEIDGVQVQLRPRKFILSTATRSSYGSGAGGPRLSLSPSPFFQNHIVNYNIQAVALSLSADCAEGPKDNIDEFDVRLYTPQTHTRHTQLIHFQYISRTASIL